MTQGQIKEFNTLCAKFLGYKLLFKKYQYKYFSSSNEESWGWNERYIVCDEHGEEVNLYPESDPIYDLSDIPFNSDWNWIMEIIEKIEKDLVVSISMHKCIIQTVEQYIQGDGECISKVLDTCKLDAVVQAVYEFLKQRK